MRFGAPVFDFSTPDEWVDRHVQEGLGAAYWPLHHDAPADQEQAYVAAARKRGLVIAEVGVWNNLLDRDETTRERNICYAIERLALAERIGARCCVNIVGSLSPTWDGPHPDNYAPQTLDQIVTITRRIIDAVNPKTAKYALEPMPWMIPDDADSMAWLLETVDREALGVHVDMVNMMNSPKKVYATGGLTRAFFERFGARICSVHAKDLRLDAGLTTHIDEALPGEGLFDFETLLDCCAGLSDLPVMAEHLETQAQYHQAISFLQGRAQLLALRYDVAEA